MLKFEWDESKNRLNRRKHGLWFEEALVVFDDPHSPVFVDPDHADEEDRFLIIGMNLSGKVLVVAHCFRENDSVIRLISARKATRKERKKHEEGI